MTARQKEILITNSEINAIDGYDKFKEAYDNFLDELAPEEYRWLMDWEDDHLVLVTKEELDEFEELDAIVHPK
jgi:hypothetical protein